MKLPMDDVNWGSIGCGNVMEVKSGPALQSIQHSQLLAVMRRNSALARDFAQRHGVPAWYDQPEDLLADPKVNAIYIATPPDTHLKYTQLAAATGRPIYVEKPMANSYAACKEMIRICEAHKVPLFVAYYRRALPAYLKIRDILASGRLGGIVRVDVQLLQQAKKTDIRGDLNWRVMPSVSGCGYFCDLASHIIDILQFLLGDIIEARGEYGNTGGYYRAEDWVNAQFTFPNDVSGRGHFDFNAEKDVDITQITGTYGSLSYSHFTDAPIRVNTDKGQEAFHLPHPRHIQKPFIQLMVDDLRHEGSCPSTGKSAARTNWVMDKILGRI